MNAYPSKKKLLAILTFFIVMCSAVSLTAQQPTDSGKDRIPGWEQWTGKLSHLDEHLLAQLPERLRNDPQIRQDAGRLLIGAVAAQSIAVLGADQDHPVFLPSLNFYLQVGQPNADTTYRSAAIDGKGSYRLRGEIGSVRIFRVGLFGPAPNNSWFSLPVPTYYDFKTLHLDAQGHFDVLLSAERPADYTGDWWKLEAKTQQLLLRQVASNWATELDPRITIERIDKPVQRPRPSAGELQKRLETLGDQIEHSALLLVNHVETLRKQGFVNKLTVFDVSHMGGLVGQSYYEGAYEIKPDEALILEAKVPQGCTYWSIILTNDLFETTDWYNNQSSLNDSQARVDADGVVRYVVSAKDPGVPNWLDTSGYRSGAIQGRWAECSSNPIPTVRKVDFSQIRASLPSDTPTVTPQDREKNIRERRSQLQQRSLW
jgi:hypothetical protein